MIRNIASALSKLFFTLLIGLITMPFFLVAIGIILITGTDKHDRT